MTMTADTLPYQPFPKSNTRPELLAHVIVSKFLLFITRKDYRSAVTLSCLVQP